MLRKFFGGDSSAELILLIRPNPRKKKKKKREIKEENRKRCTGKLTIPTDYFPRKSEPPHPSPRFHLDIFNTLTY
jgi:hypothetical protein